jgi:hypothetical protein
MITHTRRDWRSSSAGMGRFRHGAQDWRRLGQTVVGQAVRGGRGVTRSVALGVRGRENGYTRPRAQGYTSRDWALITTPLSLT